MDVRETTLFLSYLSYCAHHHLLTMGCFVLKKEFGCCDVNMGDVVIVRSDPANIGSYIYVYGRVIDTKCGGEIIQVSFISCCYFTPADK